MHLQVDLKIVEYISSECSECGKDEMHTKTIMSEKLEFSTINIALCTSDSCIELIREKIKRIIDTYHFSQEVQVDDT